MDLHSTGPPRLRNTIRQQRQLAGLTQRELADRARVSLAALRDLEQGRVSTPRASTLGAIGAALGLSATETNDLIASSERNATRRGLHVDILGPLVVSYDGIPLELGSTRQRTLLAALCMSPNKPVGYDALIYTMWGRSRRSGDIELLQTQLSRLRKRLQVGGPGQRTLIQAAAPGTYQLNVLADQLDMLTFQRITAEARKLRDGGNLADASHHYEGALALWRDEPLADLTELRANPAVIGLAREWQETVIEYALLSAAMTRFDAAIPHLRRILNSDPLNEPAQAQLMIALAGSGQQAAALATFEDARQRLHVELGATPGSDLSNAHRRVLRQEITRPDTAPVRGHRQLPPDIADFTGRESEMVVVHENILNSRRNSAASAIAVIEGMAGVGKTKLAVHFSHRLISAGQYREVQLYVDLRGYSEQPPADPATVLGAFLELLGVDRAEIPQHIEARSALYRELLEKKCALVLLDNAASRAQLMPLLPTGASNLALVTSRKALAIEGANALSLKSFTEQEACELLALVAGSDRANSDPVSSHLVIDLCGRLPIAVGLAARRLQSRPTWSVADLAARLAESTGRLRELSAGSRRTQAAFDLSYQALAPQDQRVFRLLGLHPSDEFGAGAITALLDIDGSAVLRDLADEHLIDDIGDDRYRLHDLLRLYALEQAHHSETPEEVQAARHRLFVWYLHAAVSARTALSPLTSPLDLEEITPPKHLVTFRSRNEALSWYTIERPSLVTCIAAAVEAGELDIAWRLAAALRTYFYLSKHWDDWIATHTVVLDGLELSDDARGKASTLNGLGVAYSDIGRIEAAIDCHVGARSLYAQVEEPAAAGWNLNNLGVAYSEIKEFAESIACHKDAVAHFRQVDDLNGMGIALNNLGDVCRMMGRFVEAHDHLNKALAIQHGIDDREMQRFTHCALGDLFRDMGQNEPAAEEYDLALALSREYEDQWGIGRVLLRVADMMEQVGQSSRARDCLSEALTVFVDLGDARADEIRRRLHAAPG